MVYRDSPTQLNKVIIFDWDDTICPSSFVDRWQVEHFDELPVNYQRLFNEVCRVAERCLFEASKYGEVILITNSDDGWVRYSCERYLPRLLPTLERYRVVSARTRYERFYPSQPLCWKAAAFAHEVNELYEHQRQQDSVSCTEVNTSCPSLVGTDVSSSSSEDSFLASAHSPYTGNAELLDRKEIISFGDSMEERTAVRIVSEQLDATPKSVMFVQSPTPIQIIGQLHMLVTHMKFVCEHESSLDLEISPTQADRNAQSYIKRQKVTFAPTSDSSPRSTRERHLAEELSHLMLRRSASEGSDVVPAASSG